MLWETEARPTKQDLKYSTTYRKSVQKQSYPKNQTSFIKWYMSCGPVTPTILNIGHYWHLQMNNNCVLLLSTMAWCGFMHPVGSVTHAEIHSTIIVDNIHIYILFFYKISDIYIYIIIWYIQRNALSKKQLSCYSTNCYLVYSIYYHYYRLSNAICELNWICIL